MSSRQRFSILAVVALLAAVPSRAGAQTPMGTAFTYQGRLTDAGNPANGQYDLEFRLYDAVADGNQVGDPVAVEDQPVSNGLFTVALDFRGTPFNGQARWLDVRVRQGASTGEYTPLTPRQPVTAAPYALGLALPFSGETHTSSSEEAAFSVVNSGSGAAAWFSASQWPALIASTTGGSSAAAFVIDNASANNPAVWCQTNGVGPAVAGFATGAGPAGGFGIVNPSSSAPALYAKTDGTGLAGHFDGSAYFAGNVGIGTSVPGARLEIGLDGPGEAVELNQRATDGEIHVNLRNNNGFWRISGPRSLETSHQLGFFWNDNDTFHQIMSLQANGNVGIGTDNPRAPLEIAGVSGANSESLLVAGLGRFENSIQVHHNIHGGINNELSLISTLPNEDNASSIRFSTSDGFGPMERMRITPEGNVGIGTSNAGAKLTIAGAGSDWTYGHSALHVDDCNSYFDFTCGMVLRGSGSSWATRFTSTNDMNSDGEIVGIYRGELNAGQVLDSTGSIIATFRNDGKVGIGRNPTTNLLEVEGNVSKTTAGGWLANSDCRIKTEIKTVSDALAKLDRVRLVEFRYTDAYRSEHPEIADRRYVNVVAQEFREVFPDYVNVGGDTLADGESILQVDSYPLTVYAAAGVQELHQLIRQKDAKIADLESRMKALEETVTRLSTSANGGGR